MVTQETAIRTRPPSQLSPILVGILIHKKITPDTIAAFILDMCDRGYLFISQKDNQFFMARKQAANEHLLPWEAEILGELIKDTSSPKISNFQLEDPRIFRTFGKVYTVADQLDLFINDPRSTRINIKLWGLILYLVGAIGLISVAVANLSALYIIVFGLFIIISQITIKLAGDFIRLSSSALEQKSKWLEFKNFLQSAEPLDRGNEYLFVSYLPYAIALGCATSWAARFGGSTLATIKPEWYYATANMSIDQLNSEIIKFTEKIGQQFILLKGPQVN